MNTSPQLKVKQQLAAIGSDFQFVGRAEINELPKILFEDEILRQVVWGRYSNGFALLCATNQRVLLIDKKPMYLTLEDIRYDMISDIMLNRRMLDSSITLGTVHKSITFKVFNQAKITAFSQYVQEKVMHSRSHQGSMMAGMIGSPQENASMISSAYEAAQSASASHYPNVSSSATTRSPYRNPVVIKKRASKFFPDFFPEQ